MTERGRENKPFQIKEAVCRCCLTLGCIPWKVDRNLRVGGRDLTLASYHRPCFQAHAAVHRATTHVVAPQFTGRMALQFVNVIVPLKGCRLNLQSKYCMFLRFLYHLL